MYIVVYLCILLGFFSQIFIYCLSKSPEVHQAAELRHTLHDPGVVLLRSPRGLIVENSIMQGQLFKIMGFGHIYGYTRIYR